VEYGTRPGKDGNRRLPRKSDWDYSRWVAAVAAAGPEDDGKDGKSGPFRNSFAPGGLLRPL